MKFYLASGLDNVESARFFRDGLVRDGHEQTYDWTQHGAVAAHGIERIREVAAAEMHGVECADFVVVVLPGWRGTHFEMGAAHALGKPIFVYAPRFSLVDAHPDTCAFYHLPGVRALSGDAVACLHGITEAIKALPHPKTVPTKQDLGLLDLLRSGIVQSLEFWQYTIRRKGRRS